MVEEKNLFPFDLQAFPFQNGVKMDLISYPGECGVKARVVVPIGKKGERDSGNIAFYGSVHKVGDEYWMWYLGDDSRDGRPFIKPRRQKICMAKSKDGRNWWKPDLGAYEHNGNTHNNVCDLAVEEHIMSCVVFYDPDEEDKNKVFKLNFETPKYNRAMAVAFSPDGVHWTEYEQNPVNDLFFEQSGGMKRDGIYYVTGQCKGGHYSPKGAREPRSLVTYCSRDFIHWTPANCMGFNRESLPPNPTYYGDVNGCQVHLGAGLWNRGNVIIGFYGMWDALPMNDRKFIYMNLGMVISHDGLHYYEPIPNFPIIEAREQKNGTVWEGEAPAIAQCQGFENIGDKTVTWFGLWPSCDCDGVREAVWERDRLGYFQPYLAPTGSFVMTNDLEPAGGEMRLYLNISRDTEYCAARVSLLDAYFQPISGYTVEDCDPIEEDSFRKEVTWRGNGIIKRMEPTYVRIDFEGIRREDFKLYAMYVEEQRNG